MVGELPEDDVEDLDGLLRRVCLPPGDELAEVVEVGARGKLDDDPVFPLAAGSASSNKDIAMKKMGVKRR